MVAGKLKDFYMLKEQLDMPHISNAVGPEKFPVS